MFAFFLDLEIYIINSYVTYRKEYWYASMDRMIYLSIYYLDLLK